MEVDVPFQQLTIVANDPRTQARDQTDDRIYRAMIRGTWTYRIIYIDSETGKREERYETKTYYNLTRRERQEHAYSEGMSETGMIRYGLAVWI